MRLRAQRRTLVVWSQSDGTYRGSRGTRPGRPSRIRRGIRIGIRLTLLSLLPLARAVRARWRPLLAGTVLTAVGITLRGSTVSSVVLLPGLLLLLSAPLIPGIPEAARRQHSELERELAVYTTSAQRNDLEATLDQYPDDVTHELREILAGQAVADRNNRWQALGRY